MITLIRRRGYLVLELRLQNTIANANPNANTSANIDINFNCNFYLKVSAYICFLVPR